MKIITYTKATKTKQSKVLINGAPRERFPSRRRSDHAVFNKMRQKANYDPNTPHHKVTIIRLPNK